MFLLIFTQTLKLSFRKGGGAMGACAFYVMAATLFTFALGPQAAGHYAPAMLAVALLLATVTALPLLFERDWEDCTLEQYLLQPVLLEFVVLAKLAGAWAAQMLPMLLVSPLLALMAGVSDMRALLPLLLASPTLMAIGAIGAALTLGARRGGLLQALVVLPLMVPVLIFASGEGQGNLLFLTGLLCASIPLSAFTCAALMRMSE
jgi:heme exporter protein B